MDAPDQDMRGVYALTPGAADRRRFAAGYGSLAPQIRAALVSGDRANAQRLAHSVKSVAANVGATGVEQLAASLETALTTNHPDADVQQQLSVLERELGAW